MKNKKLLVLTLLASCSMIFTSCSGTQGPVGPTGPVGP